MTYVSFVYLEPTHIFPCRAGRCLNIWPNKLLSSPGYSDASKVVHKIAFVRAFEKTVSLSIEMGSLGLLKKQACRSKKPL